MSFSPGQIITAQRLNRLQSKTYWAQASGAIAGAGSGDVAGTSQSITVQTNGATASFVWTCAAYASGAMASNANTQAVWDSNGSPTYALCQWTANLQKGTAANVWSTTISTAGTYTFKLSYTNVANCSLATYTALMVTITEVA